MNIQKNELTTDEKYMREAIKQAKKAEKLGEVPIGCVIVYEDKIIGRGYNRRMTDKSTLSHAEIKAIKKACKVIGDWRLEGCTLYVTLEPCMMCTGAIALSRIRRLYYGTSDPKGGTIHTLVDIKSIPHLNTYPKEIIPDVMHDECAEILTSFFKEKRRIRKLLKKEQKH